MERSIGKSDQATMPRNSKQKADLKTRGDIRRSSENETLKNKEDIKGSDNEDISNGQDGSKSLENDIVNDQSVGKGHKSGGAVPRGSSETTSQTVTGQRDKKDTAANHKPLVANHTANDLNNTAPASVRSSDSSGNAFAVINKTDKTLQRTQSEKSLASSLDSLEIEVPCIFRMPSVMDTTRAERRVRLMKKLSHSGKSYGSMGNVTSLKIEHNDVIVNRIQNGQVNISKDGKRSGREKKANGQENDSVSLTDSSPDGNSVQESGLNGNQTPSSLKHEGSFSSKRGFTGKSTLPRSNTLSSGVASEPAEDDDTVNVVVRVRPLSEQEEERHDKNIIQFPGEGGIWIDTGFSTKSFTFNVTFEAEAKQSDVFEHSGVKKLIEMALNGYSCTAFAFGQTGSGKTHTITGPPELFQDGHMVFSKEQYGLIPRSFHYLFHLMKQQPRAGFRITASYLEIYNEQVMDLLNPNQRRNLMVRWSKNKGFYVENLFHVECESVDDLLAVLEEGLRNRATGANSVNEHSSRSHSMLSLHLDSDHQDPDDENLYITKHGKLTFVDLAGSEKTKTDGKSDQSHLLESNNINRSLLVLGNCISSLGDAKKRGGHIPYRDSKLTKLLADSLGGNGVTLMIACVSPSGYNGAESMNTLRYANRAKKIKSKPVIKMDPREKLILSLKREVKVLRQENHYLRQQLEFPVKPKGQLQKENDEKFLRMLKEHGIANRGSDGGLYEMLQEYMIENEFLRNENSDLHQARDQGRREQQALARENERLLRHAESIQHGQMVGGTHRSMDGTPVSMYSLTSTSRKSSADPRAEFYGSPGGTPPSYRQPQPITTPRGGAHVNGYSSSPRMGHHQKRPPHRLSEPLNKSNPAFVDTTPRNGNPTTRYEYQQPPAPANQPGSGPPTGPSSPQQRASRAPQPQVSTGPVPSPRKQRGPHPSQGPFKNGSQPPPNSYQHPTSHPAETAQEMNDRLRQELLSIEGEIREQSMLNSPQASSRWENR